jgi:hypothetical protein
MVDYLVDIARVPHPQQKTYELITSWVMQVMAQ